MTTLHQFGKVYRFGPTYGKWVGNNLVSTNRNILTITPKGDLEIRGDGWGPTIRSKRRVLHDPVRICRLGSKRSARAIAEMITILTAKTTEENSKNFYKKP